MPGRSRKYLRHFLRQQIDLPVRQYRVDVLVYSRAKFDLPNRRLCQVNLYQVRHQFQSHQIRSQMKTSNPNRRLPSFANLHTVRLELPRIKLDTAYRCAHLLSAYVHQDNVSPSRRCAPSQVLDRGECCAKWCTHRRRR